MVKMNGQHALPHGARFLDKVVNKLTEQIKPITGPL